MSDSPLSATPPPEEPPRESRFFRLPRLSGKATAACLVAFFVATALLIPAVLRLPPWIEYEIVVAVWWAAWLVVLTALLYRGQRVTDDHQLGEPRNWLTALKGKPADEPKKDPLDIRKKNRGSSSGWWDGLSWLSFGDGEGCLVVIGIILALIVAFFALWFLIEIAIPVLLFLLYCVARGMLAAVINDRHHCRGRLLRSFAWGLTWATVYTAPLAGLVWFVHYLLLSRQAVG